MSVAGFSDEGGPRDAQTTGARPAAWRGGGAVVRGGITGSRAEFLCRGVSEVEGG